MRVTRRNLVLFIFIAMLLSGGCLPVWAETLKFPAMVKIIEEEAFYEDHSLDKVELSENTEEIHARAFAGSTLTQINLPERIHYISEDAFDHSALKTVIAAEGTYAYKWATEHGYTVTEPEVSTAVPVSANNINETAATEVGTIVNKNTLTLGKGNKLNLFTGDILPQSDEIKYSSFSSSNAKVISVDNNGVVTAKGKGKATLTVTAEDGRTGVITVTVMKYPSSITIAPTALTVGENDTSAIKVSFKKNYYSAYTFTCTDPSIASVDALTGTVTGCKAGSATITCACVSGKLKAKCKVTVLPAPETIAVRQKELEGYVGKKDLKVEGTCPSGTMCSFRYSVLEGDDIVSIEQNTGLLTLLKKGSAKIQVTASNNPSAAAQCIVNVYEAPSKIVLSRESINMGKGNTLNLLTDGIVSVLPEDAIAEYTFKSSSSAVKVSANGVLKAAKTGKAVITISTMNGLTKKLSVKVSRYPKTMTLSPSSLKLGVMSTETLKVTFGKNTASLYKFSSSDPSVATVDANGAVTAISAGKAVITCACVSGSKKATCNVTVVREPSSVEFLSDEYKIGLGEKLQTCVEDDTGYCRAYTYTSLNEDIVTINKDGLITGSGIGTAEITVTAFNDVSNRQKCTVSVYPLPKKITPENKTIEIGWGDSAALNITAFPEGTFSNYTYTGSKPDIVSVSANGTVRGSKKGTAVITVTASNGVSTSVKVKVIAYSKAGHPVENIAHRGASGDYPPGNTITAFEHAKKLGADLIELDVQISKDGIIFVRHDTEIGKTSLNKLTYETIRAKDPNVCTLEEALDCIHRYGIGVMIEFKVSGIEKKTLKIVNDCEMYDKVSYGAFDLSVIQKIKSLDPSRTTVYIIKEASIFKNVLASPDPGSYNCVSCLYDLLSEAKIATLHLNGCKVAAWTVDDKKVMQSLINMGVDSIITNFPERLRDIL